MDKNKQKNSGPEHSIWSNTKYVFTNLWKWDKRYFLLGFVRVPIAVLLPFLSILMTKLIIDAVTNQSAPQTLLAYVLAITGTMMVLTWADCRTDALIWWNATNYRFRYISMINKNRMTTDYETLISQKGQHLLNRALSATSNNGAASQRSLTILITIFSNALGFFLYSAVIAFLNPWIILLLVVTTLISFLGMEYCRKYDLKLRGEYSPVDTKLGYIISRSGDLSYAKDIRLYSFCDCLVRMYELFAKKRMYYHKKQRIRLFMSALLNTVLVAVRDLTAYAVLINMLVSGNMTAGNFVLYLGAVAGFGDWLFSTINQINQYNSISLDIGDMRSFLELKDKTNTAGVPLPDSYELELRNVCYRYGKDGNDILRNISLKIKQGEKLAIVGVNGAGKTTLAGIICGLLFPTGGEVLLNGVDIREYNTEEYYRLFAAVFQNVSFLPMSISENISMANEDADTGRLWRSLDISGLANKVFTLPLQLKTRLVKSVNGDAIELSGGEIQKLALARAVYKDAPMLVLDEPTAALDPIAENEVYLRYNELAHDKTAIFISHRLSSTRFCDRIIFLENGEIKEAGSHLELMDMNGGYAEMYGIQSYYYQKELAGKRCLG